MSLATVQLAKIRKLGDAKGLVGVDVCGHLQNNLAPLRIPKDAEILQPSDSILGYIHIKEMLPQLHKDTHQKLLTAVLFVVTRSWRPPGCLLLGEGQYKVAAAICRG